MGAEQRFEREVLNVRYGSNADIGAERRPCLEITPARSQSRPAHLLRAFSG